MATRSEYRQSRAGLLTSQHSSVAFNPDPAGFIPKHWSNTNSISPYSHVIKTNALTISESPHHRRFVSKRPKSNNDRRFCCPAHLARKVDWKYQQWTKTTCSHRAIFVTSPLQAPFPPPLFPGILFPTRRGPPPLSFLPLPFCLSSTSFKSPSTL